MNYSMLFPLQKAYTKMEMLFKKIFPFAYSTAAETCTLTGSWSSDFINSRSSIALHNSSLAWSCSLGFTLRWYYRSLKSKNYLAFLAYFDTHTANSVYRYFIKQCKRWWKMLLNSYMPVFWRKADNSQSCP